MTLPALAQLQDLEARLGVQDNEYNNPIRARAVLDDVSVAIRTETEHTWCDDSGVLIDNTEALDILRSVACSVAERKLRNPSGVVQESTGPFSGSFGPNAADGIYFTKSERSSLTYAVKIGYPTSSGIPGLGVIRTTRGPIETRPVRSGVVPWDFECGD